MLIWSNEHVLHSETSLLDYHMEVNAVSAFHEVFCSALIWKCVALSYKNNPKDLSIQARYGFNSFPDIDLDFPGVLESNCIFY